MRKGCRSQFFEATTSHCHYLDKMILWQWSIITFPQINISLPQHHIPISSLHMSWPQHAMKFPRRGKDKSKWTKHVPSQSQYYSSQVTLQSQYWLIQSSHKQKNNHANRIQFCCIAALKKTTELHYNYNHLYCFNDKCTQTYST